MENKKLKVGNVPPLRFPGFEGEWQTKKLGEIMNFKVTNSFSRDNLNYENGIVKNIHYGDIHTKYQTLFNIANEVTPYINNEINIHRISEDNYCQEGDIIFADASEDLRDVGKSIEVINLNGEKLLSGLHTLLARPQKNIFHLGFNGYLFKSNLVRTQIQKESQGTKVLSINTGRISKIKLSFPNPKEQKKIASFLSLIDQRIATQNKIIEQLETLIKGLCQKLILSQSPNIKLKDCVYCYSSALTESTVMNENGIYPVYGANGIISFIDNYQIDSDSILIIKDGAGVGKVQFARGKLSVIGTLNYFIAKSGTNLKYIFYSLKFFNFEKYKVGSGIPHIYFKDYGESLIFCPSFEEQRNIEQLLSSIDEKINIQKILLQKYELQKKHLLQNLFI
ncbi:restriction endonuclease subunit S [Elizabethkingia miricola]|uniref:Restriction endonuclease subunit S n=1 Tax=Elizabethkingia miricola TaxID=172045 RepID=A0ABD5B250_ELIMR|nr:restriction endonuclease subunit S [Elizabethkingia miricola]MDQ8747865.1 restriction endonuclease subunit S [Elizabethkingia miricola]